MGSRGGGSAPPPPPERQFEKQARYSGPGFAGTPGGLTAPSNFTNAAAELAPTLAGGKRKGILDTKTTTSGSTTPSYQQSR